MKEEDSNWFSKWEEELPPLEELTPLSQTLITRDLALAFDIQRVDSNNNFNSSQFHHRLCHQQPPQSHHIHHQRQRSSPHAPLHHSGSGDFDSSSAELGGGGCGGGGSGSGDDEPARTLKRPRLVWTPQLHKRFVDAVAHLGIKNAVPKTIMQLMSVDGLTRENVASHLQKYRLYLKRMQGINNGGAGGGGGGGGGALVGLGDPATDHLFASSPVPAHFLHPQSGGGYVPPSPSVAALHHHQVAAMMARGQYHQHHRQMGHFGSPGGQFEHPFLSRQTQMGAGFDGHRVVQNSVPGCVEDVESGTATNRRKVLTLFPTGDD